MDKQYEVSFIGQPHGARKGILRGLVKDGVALWRRGHGCPYGRVSQDGYAAAISGSKINLNFCGTSQGNQKHITARVFEVTGCGGFLLTDYAAGLEEYFDLGKEIVVFDGYDELLEKIRYYSTHDEEREKIAATGHKRCMAEHTYEQRFRHIFKTMGAA